VNVQEKTRDRLRQLAERERITLGELIERAIEAYEKGGGRE
jgi:predicted transcriptional regulator